MSYHLYQTRGFILKSFDVGEADKLFHIFTEDLGLVAVRAQAVRKQISKLRPSLREYTFSRFVLVRGKNTWRLTDVFETVSLGSGKAEKLKIVASLFALVRRFVQGEEENKELFRMLFESFEFLRSEDLSKDELSSFEAVAVLKILSSLGYIGESKASGFIGESFSRDMLFRSSFFRREFLREINQALDVSHL